MVIELIIILIYNKVRSELEAMSEETEEDVKTEEVVEKPVKAPEPVAVEPDNGGFHTKLARNVHRVLFQNSVPERNELFAPGRMAFVMDLEDEYAESDIPTTLIRSKADVPNAEVTFNTERMQGVRKLYYSRFLCFCRDKRR